MLAQGIFDSLRAKSGGDSTEPKSGGDSMEDGNDRKRKTWSLEKDILVGGTFGKTGCQDEKLRIRIMWVIWWLREGDICYHFIGLKVPGWYFRVYLFLLNCAYNSGSC